MPAIAERLDVAQHGALADLKLGGELTGAHPPPGLEQAQQADKTAGAHGTTIIPIHDTRCHVLAEILASDTTKGDAQ